MLNAASGFARLALLRVDLRDGRPSRGGSSAYVALRPARFFRRESFPRDGLTLFFLCFVR